MFQWHKDVTSIILAIFEKKTGLKIFVLSCFVFQIQLLLIALIAYTWRLNRT